MWRSFPGEYLSPPGWVAAGDGHHHLQRARAGGGGHALRGPGLRAVKAVLGVVPFRQACGNFAHFAQDACDFATGCRIVIVAADPQNPRVRSPDYLPALPQSGRGLAPIRRPCLKLFR